MRAGIAIVLLTLAVTSTAHAQVSSAELSSALLRIKRQVERAEGALGAFPPSAALRQRWDRTKKAVDWLNGRVDQTNPTDVTPAYLRSLARAGELDRSSSMDEWEDVASDLEAKVEHCRMLGIGMGGSVRLKIDTRRAAAPVGNWQVVYLLKIYENVKGVSPTNFPRLSTPTEAPIEPGRYWVWARDPSTGRTSERVLVRAAGQKELLVDLPVP